MEFTEKSKAYPEFYRLVWKECLKIPKGETRSYKQIAETLKRPRAARAVALALKRNPFAPFVPCHRVIRSDGRAGGYSGPGGAAAKKAMFYTADSFPVVNSTLRRLCLRRFFSIGGPAGRVRRIH